MADATGIYDMSDSAKFWDKAAEKYSKKPVPNEEVYQIKKTLTREYFTPQSTVFEFGCGTGTTAVSHAPYVKSITATDISDEMLRIAQQRATKADISNITIKKWNVDSDPILGSDYDAVLALSILHLVDDLPGALTKSHAMLKQGGVLVSSTGCLGDKMGFLRPLLWLAKLFRLAPKVAFLKTKELEHQMKAAGFQIVHSWHPKGDMAVFIIARKI